MAQLRRDHPRFIELNCQVLVVLPNGPKTISRYRDANRIPYPILSDRGGRVAEQYGVKVQRTFISGNLAVFPPTVILVARNGIIRYTDYAASYIREPDNNPPLEVLRSIGA